MKFKILLLVFLVFGSNVKPFNSNKNFYQNILPKLVLVQNVISLYSLSDVFDRLILKSKPENRDYKRFAICAIGSGVNILMWQSIARFCANKI